MGLDASFKVFVKDSDRYLETGLGSCFLNQFFDNVIVRKDNALNSVMDMGKKPMLDGVPFRGVGRVMADQNVLSDGFGELEHLLFESMVPIRVGPPGITEHEDGGCVGVMVNPKTVPPPQEVVGDEGGGPVAGADGTAGRVRHRPRWAGSWPASGT